MIPIGADRNEVPAPDTRLSASDRLALREEGREAVLMPSRWQRLAGAVSSLVVAVLSLGGILGVQPRGPLRGVAVGLLLVAFLIDLMIGFAPPPFGARIVAIRDLGPDVQERFGMAARGIERRLRGR